MSKPIPADTRVLLVDDEKHMRQLIGRMLAGLGIFHYAEAADGREALDALKVEDAPFSVILLDIDMPTLNGYNCLKEIRASSLDHIRNIPVIMLTSHSSPEAVKHVTALGIHGWLVKPTSLANLEKKLTRALNNGVVDPAKI